MQQCVFLPLILFTLLLCKGMEIKLVMAVKRISQSGSINRKIHKSKMRRVDGYIRKRERHLEVVGRKIKADLE